AADAALERADFLVQATDQLRAFLERHEDRVREIGGLTLIDEDPDYLALAPDGTFRSRSRYLDEDTGDWVSETEVIESAAELVELYNPADVYAAFAEASREAAGLRPEPTAADDLMDTAGVAPEESVAPGLDGEDPYAAAADMVNGEGPSATSEAREAEADAQADKSEEGNGHRNGTGDRGRG